MPGWVEPEHMRLPGRQCGDAAAALLSRCGGSWSAALFARARRRRPTDPLETLPPRGSTRPRLRGLWEEGTALLG
jgi:hypothetical protein